MPRPAWPWGCEGHEIIARVAEQHLTAPARRRVNELLDPTPIDPHLQRSCHPAGLDLMVDASTWADDVRSDVTSPFYGTGHWHFIDIPLVASEREASRFCPRKGCVISALNDQIAVLRAGGADHRRMGEALMFVIHLVGDLHQPLHCATNNDQGGNCVPVAYFGIEPQLSPEHPESGVYQPNLHSVWDTSIIRRIAGERSAAAFAGFLEQRFQSQLAAWLRAPIDLNGWAWESHEVGVRTAYGPLPTSIPPERPAWITQCNRVSARRLRLHERLGQRYQDAVTPAAEEQLAKAGIHLSMVLNQLWS